MKAKRKSAYTKSRLPTFGSLTTSKPMHQGSNAVIGARKSYFVGGVTQKSEDGGTRQQMTGKEPSRDERSQRSRASRSGSRIMTGQERHEHRNMTSHQPPSSSNMSFKGHSINSFKAPLS